MPAIWPSEANCNMFRARNISLSQAGVLNPLVADYLSQNEELKKFYSYFPDKAGFEKAIAENPYKNFNGPLLSETLKKQAASVKNTSAETLASIDKLKEKNVYTVTTGHQLCLFTGPLYFIYKILSAVNLAEELGKLFPGSKFVPAYWMAGEDHDFEEINHFYVYGKKVEWPSAQTGAVGDFKTEGLAVVLNSFKEVIGTSTNANELTTLFEAAYLNHSTLKEATRFLVNALFGKYGVVTVDGNESAFKAQFKDAFKKDIFDSIPFSQANSSIEKLKSLNYTVQVNPREINCFYMEPGLRARIEKDGEDFKIMGTSLSFSKEEMNTLVEERPEKISPNVVMRPVYQQQVLPNIAYVGGPGELAYWLEYKALFESMGTFFPVLVPRGFISVVEKNVAGKIEKLKLNAEDFFIEENELIRKFQKNNDNLFELGSEQNKIEELFSGIKEKINAVDKTLVASAGAEEQKAIKSLEMIVQKANKALKQKSDTEINQIKNVRQKLVPNGTPQERYDNFSSFYVSKGPDFISAIKSHIRPLDLSYTVLTEE